MHITRFRFVTTFSLFAISLSAVLSTGCSGEPVGRECFVNSDEEGTSTAIVASPALECPSRTCLRFPLPPGVALPEGAVLTDQCTAECTADDDCERMSESPCVTGFTCAVPVVTGAFCCRKMCICKDYLPENGLPASEHCDPDNELNQCCNLPGRDSQPQCQ